MMYHFHGKSEDFNPIAFISKQKSDFLCKQIPSSSEDISIIFFRTSTQNEAGKVIRLIRALATRAAIQYRLKKSEIFKIFLYKGN